MSTPGLLRRWAETIVRQARRALPAARSQWGDAMKSELAHIESDREALRWAAGCLWAAFAQRAEEEFRIFTSAVRHPAGFLPLVMSATALTVVLVRVAWFGSSRDSDEGAVAHVWQLLIAAQIPALAYFAVKSLWRATRGATYVLAAQIAGILAAAAPVFWLNL